MAYILSAGCMARNGIMQRTHQILADTDADCGQRTADITSNCIWHRANFHFHFDHSHSFVILGVKHETRNKSNQV